jgi:hypothetical protein
MLAADMRPAPAQALVPLKPPAPGRRRVDRPVSLLSTRTPDGP